MTRQVLLTATMVFGVLGASTVIAQNEKDSAPATSNVRGAQSPRVYPDGSVIFTLKAPDATGVQVAGGDGLGKGPFPMTKGDDGVWSVKTPPAVPGFHYYWFVLNGVQVNDSGRRRISDTARRPVASRSRKPASRSTIPRMFPMGRSA